MKSKLFILVLLFCGVFTQVRAQDTSITLKTENKGIIVKATVIATEEGSVTTRDTIQNPTNLKLKESEKKNLVTAGKHPFTRINTESIKIISYIPVQLSVTERPMLLDIDNATLIYKEAGDAYVNTPRSNRLSYLVNAIFGVTLLLTYLVSSKITWLSLKKQFSALQSNSVLFIGTIFIVLAGIKCIDFYINTSPLVLITTGLIVAGLISGFLVKYISFKTKPKPDTFMLKYASKKGLEPDAEEYEIKNFFNIHYDTMRNKYIKRTEEGFIPENKMKFINDLIERYKHYKVLY